jgi:hypothetical protein
MKPARWQGARDREGGRKRERAGTEAHRLGREPALVHMSNRPCRWVAVYLWTSTSMVRPLVDRPPSPWVERNPQQKTGVARARLTLPTHMTAKARGAKTLSKRGQLHLGSTGRGLQNGGLVTQNAEDGENNGGLRGESPTPASSATAAVQREPVSGGTAAIAAPMASAGRQGAA